MTTPVTLAMYADLHCPYAYLTAYRLRQLRSEWRGTIRLIHKSLALEYVNRRSTPKTILEVETPMLLVTEPEIPYQPWHQPESEWPVTMWPAFEAVKCAERQDADLADDLAWAIRTAFFHDSRCISMRHVLFELAEGVGLDMARFEEHFDGGVTKHLVVEEAREGWERLQVEGSPTFVLPNGEQRSYVGLPKIELDERQHYKPMHMEPAPDGGDPLDPYRKLLAEARACGECEQH